MPATSNQVRRCRRAGAWSRPRPVPGLRGSVPVDGVVEASPTAVGVAVAVEVGQSQWAGRQPRGDVCWTQTNRSVRVLTEGRSPVGRAPPRRLLRRGRGRRAAIAGLAPGRGPAKDARCPDLSTRRRAIRNLAPAAARRGAAPSVSTAAIAYVEHRSWRSLLEQVVRAATFSVRRAVAEEDRSRSLEVAVASRSPVATPVWARPPSVTATGRALRPRSRTAASRVVAAPSRSRRRRRDVASSKAWG